MAQNHRDFYTVPEAADALGVSVSTIRRWIADRRLPAFRLGPKALRIKKQDVDAAGSQPHPVAERTPAMRVITDLREIGQMTDEERERGLVAFEQARAFRHELLAKRGGKRFSDSTQIIRSEREKRTRHLEEISKGSAEYRAAKQKADGRAKR